jgi:sodium/potassium-transporting ATPase subunit alpha
MIPAKCTAIRERQFVTLAAQDLVKGDIVFVKMGDKVPADILLIKTSEMKVDNSSLTGESEPQDRFVINTHDNALEASNLAFNGTLVVAGEGFGIVIRTGDDTVIGQIASLTQNESKRTSPLTEEIESFVKIIGSVAIVTAVVFFLISAVKDGNIGFSFNFAVGVLVAWVPQGLPATVTMLLTFAAKRMAGENVLVKDLKGVETLGAITLLATDKTGTLTRNQMTVANMWTEFNMYTMNVDARSAQDGEIAFDSTAQGVQDILHISAMCSRARFNSTDVPMDEREIIGDATETGLYRLSTQKLKEFDTLNERYPKIFEIPFNSDTKWHLSIHQYAHESGSLTLFVKGAPERVLRICSTILSSDGLIDLTEDHKAQFLKNYEHMAGKGHRVLAFAKLQLPESTFPKDFEFSKETKNYPMESLTFVGLASLEDPPKHGVREAVGNCRTAGVKVVMVTGDHPLTAEAIGRKINLMLSETKEGLAKQHGVPESEIHEDDVNAIVIHGEKIDSLTEEEWDNIFSKDEIIFARTSPKHKLQIVKRAQALGHIVGVTGDGVNDSPALKKADLGIAMNISGSDVSKEAAAMILLDDNFASIINGIREGRLIFINLKKSIQYVLTHSIPEVIPQILYVLVPIPVGLNALQILVIDLGFELLAALSFAFEPPESDSLMQLPPRKPVNSESIEFLRSKSDFDSQFLLKKKDEEVSEEPELERPLVFRERLARLMSREYWSTWMWAGEQGEVLVDSRLLSWSYIEGGLIQYLGAQITFFFVMYMYKDERGTNLWFTPQNSRDCMLQTDNKFGSGIPSDPVCVLPSGYRMVPYDQAQMLAQAQAAFYLSVMIGQMWNLLACKSRLSSPFSRNLFRNRYTWYSILAGCAFAVAIVHIPGVNRVFRTSGKFNPIAMLIPMGAGLVLFCYAALRFYVLQKLRPTVFAPKVIGLSMHPTRFTTWSRRSR